MIFCLHLKSIKCDIIWKCYAQLETELFWILEGGIFIFEECSNQLKENLVKIMLLLTNPWVIWIWNNFLHYKTIMAEQNIRSLLGEELIGLEA